MRTAVLQHSRCRMQNICMACAKPAMRWRCLRGRIRRSILMQMENRSLWTRRKAAIRSRPMIQAERLSAQCRWRRSTRKSRADLTAAEAHIIWCLPNELSKSAQTDSSLRSRPRLTGSCCNFWQLRMQSMCASRAIRFMRRRRSCG